MVRRYAYLLFPAAVLFLHACKNLPSQNHGPIVLGDSSMIVTETDPTRLQDMVTDLKPTIKTSEQKDAEDAAAAAAQKEAEQKAAAAETTVPDPTPAKGKPQPQQPQQPALTGSGLRADFAGVSVLIPNVTAKISGNADLMHANGAVYTWQSGTVNNNTIKVSGSVTKVSQRYQTIIVLNNDGDILPLDNLSTTTGWEAMKGINGSYQIKGLDERSLDFYEASRSQIKAAVLKAARRRRIKHSRLEDFQDAVSRVRAANQKPLHVVLRSVMWKIDGKDGNGKAFSKQIRLDMPL